MRVSKNNQQMASVFPMARPMGNLNDQELVSYIVKLPSQKYKFAPLKKKSDKDFAPLGIWALGHFMIRLRLDPPQID